MSNTPLLLKELLPATNEELEIVPPDILSALNEPVVMILAFKEPVVIRLAFIEPVVILPPLIFVTLSPYSCF